MPARFTFPGHAPYLDRFAEETGDGKGSFVRVHAGSIRELGILSRLVAQASEKPAEQRADIMKYAERHRRAIKLAALAVDRIMADAYAGFGLDDPSASDGDASDELRDTADHGQRDDVRPTRRRRAVRTP